jgi:small subunit ribosomal protein S18
MKKRKVAYHHEPKKQSYKMAKANEIKYLTAVKAEKRPKKYCRFKKMGIRYIDYKDADFLKKFLNEQGKLLPRRITGNSLKYQRKVSEAVKKARQMAILPYVTDLLK